MDRVPAVVGRTGCQRACAEEENTAQYSSWRRPGSHAPWVRKAERRRQRTQGTWEPSAAQLLPLGALLLVLGVSRIAGLTHQSLWYDEGYTATLAQTGSFHAFWQQFGAFTMSEHLQPLYYFFMFGWSRLFGVSDFALRLPSALFSAVAGVAACSSVWLVTRRRSMAALAAVAMLSSSFSLYYGQEARPYAMLQMLSFSFVLLWLWARRWRAQVVPVRTRWALGVLAGLCVLGSPFTALLVMCVAGADLLVSRRPRFWLRVWAPALLISAGMYLTYLLPSLLTMPTFLARDVIQIKQPLWMNIGYALFGVAYGTTLPPAISALRGAGKLHAVMAAWMTVLPALAILGLLLWTAVRHIRRANPLEPRMRSLLWALGLYAMCLFGVFGAVGRLNVLPRHTSACFALLFVAVFCVAGLHTERRGRLPFAAIFAGWLLLNGVSLYEYREGAAFAKDDYRGTAATLEKIDAPQFLVAGMPVLLNRYGAHIEDATAATPATLAATIAQRSEPGQEVAVVYNAYRNYRWDGATMGVVQAMAPRYRCGLAGHSANFDVYTCKPNDSVAARPSSSGPRTRG